MINQLPIIAVALKARDIATAACVNDGKKYQKKQRIRSFVGAFLSPNLTQKWFDQLFAEPYLVVTKYRPQLYFKLFRVYMSIKWSQKRRMKVILDTYRYIIGHGEDFMKVFTEKDGIEIANLVLGENTEASLMLGYDHKYRKEGELVFSFRCEELGGMVAAAAFSLEEMEKGKWVARIGCVQGHMLNENSTSKVAQKLLHGLRPKVLIVTAVQEFARHLNFEAVYGAGDKIHSYRKKHAIHLHWIHTIAFDYDAFWEECGGKMAKEGWFELPLIPYRKDISEVKSNKRSQYNKRYALQDEFSLKIKESAQKLVANSAH